MKYIFEEIKLNEGMGNETERYGSKVIETLLQSGHTIVDLYCPAKRSTIIDLFLLRKLSQLCFETTISG